MKYILLHGLGQTASSWEKTVNELQNKADAVCPDLFSLLQGEEINYSNLYQAFCRYCEPFPEPFAVCGLSLGGILVLQYGIENPQKVNSMVLIGTQYVMPKKLLKFQNMLFRVMPKRTFMSIGLAKNEVIRLSESMMDLDFRKDLHKIKCPLLLLCGDRDKPNIRASLNLKKRIPDADFAVIEKAGHEVNIDAPKSLGAVLNDFFGS